MNVLKKDSNPSAPRLNASMINRRQRSQRWLLITFVLIIFVVGLGIGFAFGAGSNNYAQLTYDQAVRIVRQEAPRDATTIDFQLFWEVWQILKDRYVAQPVNEQDLFYSAIAGMVAGLRDPHSLFLNPEQSKEFLEEINGSFEGIGAEIGFKNEQLTVIAPLPGSPAEQAGLLAGDRILFIDGRDTKFITINEAVSYIRGEKGTKVILTIQRAESAQLMEVAIERNTIRIESVKWELVPVGDRQIAHITLSHFNSDTPAAFRDIINQILLKSPDGLILDMRNNAGGFLDVAIDVASKFMETGETIVLEQSGDKTEKAYPAVGVSPLKDITTVVLINGGSASAAEIVAGALQDTQKAVLIGATTFGKGTVQDLQSFSDGSSLKLTIARWLTPHKNMIDAVGIEPDFVVERTIDDISNDLDPQLDAAKLYFADRVQFEEKYQKQDNNAAVEPTTN